MKLEGLYTAVVTPFDAQGNLDKDGLRKNLHYQLLHKVKGIIVLGTTGESPTLSNEEKKAVVKIAIEEIKGKATLIVGTGNYSTENTIEATREAENMGADAALIVSPYYNKPTQEGLYRHFSAIANAISLPICLYNHPGRTGLNIQIETLQRLMEIPSIIGIKETSGNLMFMNELVECVRKSRPEFAILSGDDPFTFPLMAMGGQGVISVASNLIPSPMQDLVKASLDGDYAKARSFHYQLLPFFRGAFIETNPIPIKFAMQHFGMASGECRLPLCGLTQESIQKLEKILNTLPSSWLGGYG